jgi:hypothetical protein
MFLCEYKDILGKPGEDFHAKRFMGFAKNDIIGTIVLAYIFSIVVAYLKYEITFLQSFGCWLLLAFFLHWLFCVETTLNKILGLA